MGCRWPLKYDGASLAEQMRNFLSLNILQSNRQKKPKKALQHRWLVFPSSPVAPTSQGPRHQSPGSHQQEAGTTASECVYLHACRPLKVLLRFPVSA